MARQDALSIYLNDEEKDKLSEIYGQVIEAVQKEALSEKIKNTNYSGDATSGSVEIDRFANATVDDLGTARGKGAGNKLKNSGKVVINVDTDKEIVEEVANKDLKLHGVSGVAEKRKKNHVSRMAAYLDREFFRCVEGAGTVITVAGATIQAKLEELIQSVENTNNEWVDGVDRELLVLTVTPKIYGDLENYIDSVPNSLTGLTDEYFHRVRIYSNHRQTAEAICMIEGAAGQLVTTDEYGLEKIPLSNDYALELFFSKGTKAVTPDLIKMFHAEPFSAAKTKETVNIGGKKVGVSLKNAIGNIDVEVPAETNGLLVAKLAEDNSKITFEALTGLTAKDYAVKLTDSKKNTVTITVTVAA